MKTRSVSLNYKEKRGPFYPMTCDKTLFQGRCYQKFMEIYGNLLRKFRSSKVHQIKNQNTFSWKCMQVITMSPKCLLSLAYPGFSIFLGERAKVSNVCPLFYLPHLGFQKTSQKLAYGQKTLKVLTPEFHVVSNFLKLSV